MQEFTKKEIDGTCNSRSAETWKSRYSFDRCNYVFTSNLDSIEGRKTDVAVMLMFSYALTARLVFVVGVIVLRMSNGSLTVVLVKVLAASTPVTRLSWQSLFVCVSTARPVARCPVAWHESRHDDDACQDNKTTERCCR